MWKPRHKEVSWHTQEHLASWEVNPTGLNPQLCHWATVGGLSHLGALFHQPPWKRTQWLLRNFAVLSFQACVQYLSKVFSKVTWPQRRGSSLQVSRVHTHSFYEHPSWHLLIVYSSGSQSWVISESSGGLENSQMAATPLHSFWINRFLILGGAKILHLQQAPRGCWYHWSWHHT